MTGSMITDRQACVREVLLPRLVHPYDLRNLLGAPYFANDLKLIVH